MQIGQLGSAVSELSQMLSQAIVVPFRGRKRRTQAPGHLPGHEGPRALGVRGRGTLLLAAGTLTDEQVVGLIHQVGGRQASGVVLPVAAYSLLAAGERYRRPLERYGMDKLETLPLSTRTQAEDTQVAGRVARANLVVLGGGDTGLLLQRLAGTAAEGAVVSALAGGATVCALAAAAEAVGAKVLATGQGADAGAPHLVPGLNLLPGTVVVAGRRIAGRLASVFATALTGNVRLLVLDERATLLVRSGWQAEVRSGTVLVVAGPSKVGADAPPSLGEVVTRVVPAGWKLDLTSGAVLPPGAANPPRRP